MGNNINNYIDRGSFDAFVNAVGSEIEHEQVRLITAANSQRLLHYWKVGNYILYHQQNSWRKLSGSTIPKRKAIRNVTLPICASLPDYIR